MTVTSFHVDTLTLAAPYRVVPSMKEVPVVLLLALVMRFGSLLNNSIAWDWECIYMCGVYICRVYMWGCICVMCGV